MVATTCNPKNVNNGQINADFPYVMDHDYQEKEALLGAGLQISESINVDDTGARHQGKNGFATVICNDFFAYFKSTESKSRINFLKILGAAYNATYLINDDALAYAKKLGIGQQTDAWFISKLGTAYTDENKFRS